jgi:Mor family transcriptional regulator
LGGKGLRNDDLLDELTAVIGDEAAERLIEHYSGSNVYYPKRISRKFKYRKIREEFKNGASYRELSLKYGYVERYIRVIIHKMKERKNGQ